MDEHRMGLHPILRKQWVFPGQCGVRTTFQYNWLWVYGFVEPNTGENHHYLLPHLDTYGFNKALWLFAKATQASEKNPILLILDRARSHIAKRVKLPKGVELHFLPPYSPELQPAERLWPLLNECISNRLVSTRKELERLVIDRCKWMMQEGKDLIRGLTRFHWWPTQA